MRLCLLSIIRCDSIRDRGIDPWCIALGVTQSVVGTPLSLMSTSIIARMLQLLGLLNLLYQPGVCTKLEVTMLYTQVDAMCLLLATAKMAINHYGLSNQTSIDSKEA